MSIQGILYLLVSIPSLVFLLEGPWRIRLIIAAVLIVLMFCLCYLTWRKYKAKVPSFHRPPIAPPFDLRGADNYTAPPVLS
ncbi:hypothetical protein Dsin_013732 [Dipteronia sinensis]|uniref:Uncharacterized protein n=1 Tax=Dipteronia sinensis TaxID=43782 RepID=A0AAE0ALN0_9ROSI|nr:hypothetical protein Dsin_013732 [Dipteronia sinensis]